MRLRSERYNVYHASIDLICLMPCPRHVMDVDSFLSPLVVNDECLSRLAVDFSHTYRHLALHSEDQFLATPINVLPKGTETGRFLAIDVGGTNLRVGFVELLGAQTKHGEKIEKSHVKAWSIEDHFKMDNAEELFSWIGECIAEVVIDYLAQSNDPKRFEEVLPLGITFSFPMKYAFLTSNLLDGYMYTFPRVTLS